MLTKVRIQIRAILAVALVACASLAFTQGVKTPIRPVIRMATTTSTENSGLLSYLLPIFTKETGYTVQVVAVGTGAALKLGENADADIVLVHARSQEDAFMAAGHGTERRDVMYNDFIVVGPTDDPAKIKSVKTPEEAFALISKAGANFISRGDKSGTDTAEKAIWKTAGIAPLGTWYKEAGQGMEQVIIMADGIKGYTLTDRGTWIAVKSKTSLVILCEGAKSLFNQYGVIPVNPAKNRAINGEGAKAFADWITGKRGQEVIASYKLGGEQLFFPNYRL